MDWRPPTSSRSVPERPNVTCDGFLLLVSQFNATHWRHGAGMLFRFWHTLFDCLGEACQTAVAPEPGTAAEIRSDGTADAVRAMASGACCACDLAVEDLLAERDLIA